MKTEEGAGCVQLSLFNQPTLNISYQQKELMNKAAKQCILSREQIVDQMNHLANLYGITIAKGNNGKLTLDTFEKWINPQDKNRQMPMKVLPVFCAVVNDFSTADILVRPLGCRIIGPQKINLLKWAGAYWNAKKARKEMRELEKQLK